MSQDTSMGVRRGELAKPLHIQHLEKALDVEPFLSYVEQIFNTPLTSDGSSSDSEADVQLTEAELARGSRILNGVKTNREERRLDKMRLYNLDGVKHDRYWLRELLLSDTTCSSEEEEEEGEEGEDSPVSEESIRQMLRQHVLCKKYAEQFHANPENMQYQYYSVGLLSNYDKFPEHQRSIVGNRKKKKTKKMEKKLKKIKKLSARERRLLEEAQETDELDYEDMLTDVKVEDDADGYADASCGYPRGSRSRKRAQQSRSPEVMAIRRRKIWMMMSKKELGKVQRAKINNHKEVLTTYKRLAQYCMKHWRQKAMQSQKNMKETIWRAKRLTREMQAYWKRYDRVERETRRRQEKEAEEQRKLDGELMEAKRQQRKLNFLITQTELYAHFMSRKLGAAPHKDQLRILSQLDEEKMPRLMAIDDYDSEAMKHKAKKNVQDAFLAEQARTRQYAHGVALQQLADGFKLTETSISTEDERPQPAIFRGKLKHYQLKGMNWLANLYDQGINGILADEMGLGKTVQSIAFLCHIAEKYDAWGPFLIISPASTLHNWQQEMARFVPDFKVVPYWGNPQERKILRQFWDQKGLHTREASFHVVITSYQLVISDFKYFNRIKWQYLVLDEAQALKSTSSVRWKLLLGFSCRNRLLLSGTPIQNSMAELWALLHFIMPTLFDSHDEFNEWFSKDIESHAENKTGIDEKHLSRLHMILKPFMLRRIKKDVENELSDKIEVMVYCPLTTRQKLLYSALKKKIRIEDLLYTYTGANQTSQSVTSSLMNLVMQFRKVCNHPELFERHEAKSPLFVALDDYVLPRLVLEEGLLHHCVPSKRHIVENMLSVFSPEYVHRSLFPRRVQRGHRIQVDSCFSFTRFCDLSPAELSRLVLGGLLFVLLHVAERDEAAARLHHRLHWWAPGGAVSFLLAPGEATSPPGVRASAVLPRLVFTARVGCSFHAHATHILHCTPETVEHRILRSRKVARENTSRSSSSTIPQQRTFVKSCVSEDVDVMCEDTNSPKPMMKPLSSPTHKSSPVAAKAGSSPGKGARSPTSPKAETKLPQRPAPEEVSDQLRVLPEFPHVPRPSQVLECQPTDIPAFLYYTSPKVRARPMQLYCSWRRAAWEALRHRLCGGAEGLQTVWHGSPAGARQHAVRSQALRPSPPAGLWAAAPRFGWSGIIVPDKQTLVTDAGKLYVLDGLLKTLKEQGHRVLIYSQMTRMIDLLEEYMWHRKHTYMRLDGSSKISERRDMVADFQSREDIFVFLLSTRAGGLGINLTAADTVIFYDSDWNPTVDQQAMDRAHRLGQTKQVTVYRLICKGSIEERILQRAREKSEIQRMVISGGNFKPDTLKPKEVVSLLLDDEEIEKKYRQKQAERRTQEEARADFYRERERKRKQFLGAVKMENKRMRMEEGGEDTILSVDSAPPSPSHSEVSQGSGVPPQDETSNEGLVVDVDHPSSLQPHLYPAPHPGLLGPGRRATRGAKRGRPRGSRRGGLARGRSSVPTLTINITNSDLGLGEWPQILPRLRAIYKYFYTAFYSIIAFHQFNVSASIYLQLC
ncbi:chromatin-remodeling ATPase INO80-like isoform X2 [Bacillus rossius redtenbacheri]|uniref:chromatin-remodeling ATPase INO80-like isoform X2 n=1 Tax=Bacillus rossius redtenbacheri TaxID=93214 RepID=UPI002FDD2C23